LTHTRGRVALVLVVAGLVAGCGIGAPQGSSAVPPAATATPQPTVSTAVAQTRLQVAGALAAAGFQLVDPRVPFRPPESALLAAAPRAVYQVPLPADPSHGYIVVYEFPDAASASVAGHEMATYLASGPGRVQFPSDAEHVLRQLGTTLIYYTWSPGASPGTDVATIAKALEAVGQGIAIAP
jgi:hypothetical protein